MTITTGLDVAASADVVWDLLVDVRAWPDWGPTLREVRLEGGAHRISAGSTGEVRTVLGPWLPFRVEDWREGEVRSWAWRVAGVPATEHRVRSIGPDRCRVELGVPWWAPGYLAVVALALTRIRRAAEGG
ncbi:MAG: SRPBCC family protein [Nocardioides sp.]